mmetsp:Transcript_54574/g.63796  ORF Transcript_54574/g.63796 Transcript_54574/m.63796 type:complete len:150 (+) Transcript_54574:879-1328(+)
MPVHFAKYVKQWKKNQDRRDAEIASGSNRLSNALERVSSFVLPPSLEPVSLNISPPPSVSTETFTANFSPQIDMRNEEPLLLLSDVCRNQQPRPVQLLTVAPPKKRTRTCKVVVNGTRCPNPSTCPGKNNRANCTLITGGDPSKKRIEN